MKHKLYSGKTVISLQYSRTEHSIICLLSLGQYFSFAHFRSRKTSPPASTLPGRYHLQSSRIQESKPLPRALQRLKFGTPIHIRTTLFASLHTVRTQWSALQFTTPQLCKASVLSAIHRVASIGSSCWFGCCRAPQAAQLGPGPAESPADQSHGYRNIPDFGSGGGEQVVKRCRNGFPYSRLRQTKIIRRFTRNRKELLSLYRI